MFIQGSIWFLSKLHKKQLSFPVLFATAPETNLSATTISDYKLFKTLSSNFGTKSAINKN